MEANGDEEYEKFIITAIGFFLLFFILSSIFTSFFFIRKKNGKISCTCNTLNLFIYIFFNFSIGIILGFPYIAVTDYKIYLIELIKKEEKDKYASIKGFIKTIYKVLNYCYYSLSDLIFPMLINFYLTKYTITKDYKKSLCNLKDFIFIITFICVYGLSIFIVVVCLPEPVENKIEENLGGWDYFIFTLRNIWAFGELEFNIVFCYFMGFFGMSKMFYWLYRCLPCLFEAELIINKRKFVKEREMEILSEPINANDDDEEFKITLKEFQRERNLEISDKIQKELDQDKCTYCCIIPKCIIEIPKRFILGLLFFKLFYFDIVNTIAPFSALNFSTIESDIKDEKKHEKLFKKISASVPIYILVIYLYYFGIIYSIIKRKYFKEYLPYIGGEHNGLGLLILLKYIMNVAIPVYFLVFFPLINNNHKSNIYDYFKWYLFNFDNLTQILIKLGLMMIILFFIAFGCIRNEYIEIMRKM